MRNCGVSHKNESVTILSMTSVQLSEDRLDAGWNLLRVDASNTQVYDVAGEKQIRIMMMASILCGYVGTTNSFSEKTMRKNRELERLNGVGEKVSPKNLATLLA